MPGTASNTGRHHCRSLHDLRRKPLSHLLTTNTMTAKLTVLNEDAIELGVMLLFGLCLGLGVFTAVLTATAGR